MSPSGFQHVVRLGFVERVRPELVLLLLEPYRAQLLSLGMPTGVLPYPALVSLCRALNDSDAQFPMTLQTALTHIAELSNESGYRRLLEEAEAQNIEVSFEGHRLGISDAAIWAYLFHPRLFRRAHSCVESVPAHVFADFQGSGLGDTGPPKPERVRARLQHWLERHRSGRVAAALVEELSGQLVFYFVHAPDPNAAAGADGSGSTEVTAESRDVVTYDKRTDQLSVSAAQDAAVALYQCIAGVVLAERSDYFRAMPLYSADPFRELGPNALNTADVRGLHGVKLQCVSLGSRGPPPRRTIHDGDDLREWLEGTAHSGELRNTTILSWSFALLANDNAKSLRVDVSPPNRLRLDHRVPVVHFREFMKARGFLRSPGHRSGIN